jgi:hypothetical protein
MGGYNAVMYHPVDATKVRVSLKEIDTLLGSLDAEKDQAKLGSALQKLEAILLELKNKKE